MKAIRFLFAGIFLLLWNIVVPGQHDMAQAQALCTCPAGYPNYNPATKTCASTGYYIVTVPAICGSNGFNVVGQVAASLQQNSFSTVAGVLRTARDRLQGNGPAGSTTSGISGYSPVDFDESFGMLDYASNGAAKNPLAILKAPPASPAAPAAGPSWAFWSEAFGDWERRSPLDAADIGRTQTSDGAHAGFDATWQNAITAGDFVVGGVVGSWMRAKVNLSGVPGGFTLEGPGVGVYSMYIRGPFSADLTGKVDFLSLVEDFGGFVPNASTDVTNAGLAGNVQYRSKFGERGYIEPTMGFSMTRTMFGDNAATIGLTDATIVRLQGGARFGNVFEVNGIVVEPVLGLLLYDNVVAEGTTLPTSQFAIPIAPTDRGLLRGEADPELNLDFKNGYSAYVRGTVRVGSEMFGAGGKVGVRKQF
jgi:hypothetical protein